MQIPRASANEYLCGGCTTDLCECPGDGTVCIDVGKGVSTNSSPEYMVKHVYVFGLDWDQELEIEREFKDECDPLWGPWLTCGERTILTQCNPETILTMPGRYRINLNTECNLDPEHVRIQITSVQTQFAALRIQQQGTCCCQGREQ